jgi:hypothetical protein
MSTGSRIVRQTAAKVFATSARLANSKQTTTKSVKVAEQSKSLAQTFNEYKSMSANFANQLKAAIANPSGNQTNSSAGASGAASTTSVVRYIFFSNAFLRLPRNLSILFSSQSLLAFLAAPRHNWVQ